MSEKKKFTYESGDSASSAQNGGQPGATPQPPYPPQQDPRTYAQQPSQGQPYRTGQVPEQEPSGQRSTVFRASDAQQPASRPGAPSQPERAPQRPAEPERQLKKSDGGGTKGKKTSKGGKDKKKKGKKGLVTVLTVLLVLVVAVTVLQLTNVFNFVGAIAGLFGGSPSLNTYTVDSKEYLLRYLNHPSLIPGDTLELTGSFSVDVDEDLGGFAMIPLVNYGGSGSVSFTGGTLVMSGAESKIDMSKASFSGTELYIDAPNVNLTLGSADDTNINVATLNGTAHKRDLYMPFVGTRMSIPVTFTNESGSSLSNVKVSLTSAGFIFVDGDTVTIESLGAGASATVNVNVIAVEGGRQEIIGYATDESGRLLVSGTSGYINLLGTGYYAGDVHTHTEDSQSVRFGTLEDNVSYGYQHGMSFIISVENNEEAQKLSQSEIDALVGSDGAFLQLTGGETGENLLHLLILGSDVRPRDDYGTEIMGHGQWIYQDAINEVIRDGGTVILPHFFSYEDLLTMISILKSSRGASAMEILTLDMKTTNTELNYYYNTWMAVNAQGRQKMFGVFSSNNIYSSEVGSKYISGYMPSLTEANIYAMLQSGNYIMSNGPQLRFTMGNVQMGGDIYTTTEGGMVNVSIYGSDTSPIQSVRLLKYRISGNIDDIDYEVAYEESFSGQGVYSFHRDLDIMIEPKTFYRVELITESARYYDDAGLALSNPVYVNEGQNDSYCHIDKISSALGSQIKQAPNGIYYIEKDNLKTGAISVTGTGERITVKYNVNKGDYVADYIMITMMGGNGTITSVKVYVVN